MSIPIVLLHGIFGHAPIRIGRFRLEYFGGIEQALVSRGHPVLAPAAHPTASIARRARQIRQAILSWLKTLPGSPRVLVIAHSMGGLDARYMISQLGMDRYVAALVTIATPHHGSPLADFWMNLPPVKRVGLPLLGLLGLDTGAGGDLTTAAARQFNQRIPDSPLVQYFSIGGACPPDRVPLPFRMGYRIIYRAEGENDCMVSTRSARWGRYLDTWPVHHLHAINRRFSIDSRAPVGDVTDLYLQILERLKEYGL